MRYINMFEKLIKFFTPLKMLSFVLILMAVVNHLYNPFEHQQVTNTFAETFARSIVLFCGIYGIMGNGKYLRLRAIVIGFPFLYLSFLYIFKLITSNIQTVLLPIVITLVIGLWSVLAGAEYERRATSICRCPTSNNHS